MKYTHNEIINFIYNLGIENAFTFSEKQAKECIIKAYKDLSPEGFEIINQECNGEINEMTDIAIDEINKAFNSQTEENSDNDTTSIINTNPYETSGSNSNNTYNNNQDNSASNNQKNTNNNQNVPEPDKNKTTRYNATDELCNSMPSDVQEKLHKVVQSEFTMKMVASNTSIISGFLIDTPVREHMIGKTFTIDAVDADKILKKYDDSVKVDKNPQNLETFIIDDNQYNERDHSIIKEGPNMTAWREIKSILQGNRTFNVRVPAIKDQKELGIEVDSIQGSGEKVIIKNLDLPITLLAKYAGRIPGSPGVAVTGISCITKKSVENGVISTKPHMVYDIKSAGKGEAKEHVSGKYIRQTSTALTPEEASSTFGKEYDTCSVKSEKSFQIYAQQETTDDNGNPIKKQVKRTVRISGRIEVPYFKRKPEYSTLGEVLHRNQIAYLTNDNLPDYEKTVSAFMMLNSSGNSDSLGSFSKDMRDVFDSMQNNGLNTDPVADEL